MTKDASKLMEKALNLSSKEMDSSGFKLQSAPKTGAIKAAAVSLPKFAKAKLSAKRISKTSTPYSGKAEIKVPKPTISVSKTTVAAIPVAKLPEIANAKDPTSRLPFAKGGTDYDIVPVEMVTPEEVQKQKRLWEELRKKNERNPRPSFPAPTTPSYQKNPGKPIKPRYYEQGILGEGEYALSTGGAAGRKGYAVGGSPEPLTVGASPTLATATATATPQPIPAAQPSTVANTIPQYRSDYVLKTLGRPITENESSQWQGYLDQKQLNDQQIQDAIANSPEGYRNWFTNFSLGRNITPEENTQWQGYIKNNQLTDQQVEDAILNSADSRNYYKQAIVKDALGRDITPEESKLWDSYINQNNLTDQQIEDSIYGSEAAQKYSDQQYLKEAYNNYYNRDPSQAEMDYVLPQLNQNKINYGQFSNYLENTPDASAPVQVASSDPTQAFQLAANKQNQVKLPEIPVPGQAATTPSSTKSNYTANPSPYFTPNGERGFTSNSDGTGFKPHWSSQQEALADGILAEAGNQDLTGKTAVGYNIVNRALNGYRGDKTIIDVLTHGATNNKGRSGAQYSSVLENNSKNNQAMRNTMKLDKSDPRWQEAYKLAGQIMNKEVEDTSNKASHYLNKKTADAKGLAWYRTMLDKTKHGDHWFGREKGFTVPDQSYNELRGNVTAAEDKSGVPVTPGSETGSATTPTGGVYVSPGAPSDSASTRNFYQDQLYSNDTSGKTGYPDALPGATPPGGIIGDSSGGGTSKGAALEGDGSNMVPIYKTITTPGTTVGPLTTSTGQQIGGTYNAPATTKTVIDGYQPAWQAAGFQSQSDYADASSSGYSSAQSYYSDNPSSDAYFVPASYEGESSGGWYDPIGGYVSNQNYNPFSGGTYTDELLAEHPDWLGIKRGGSVTERGVYKKALKLAKEPSLKDTLRLAKERLADRRNFKSGGIAQDIDYDMSHWDEARRKKALENRFATSPKTGPSETTPKSEPTDITPKISPEEYHKGKLGEGRFALAGGGTAAVSYQPKAQDSTNNFVITAYEEMLGRKPSKPELTAWVDYLDQGGTDKGGLMSTLAQSVEGANWTNTKAVDQTFWNMAGRQATQADYDTYLPQLAAGTLDYTGLRNAISKDPDAQNYQNTQLLNDTAYALLGRPATQKEQNDYLPRLADGTLDSDKLFNEISQRPDSLAYQKDEKAIAPKVSIAPPDSSSFGYDQFKSYLGDSLKAAGDDLYSKLDAINKAIQMPLSAGEQAGLDLISKLESGGNYNMILGDNITKDPASGRIAKSIGYTGNLDQMPLNELYKMQGDMLRSPANNKNSSAVGKLQFTRENLFGTEKAGFKDGQLYKFGITPDMWNRFSLTPALQDKLGAQMAIEKRGMDLTNPNTWGSNAHNEWASMWDTLRNKEGINAVKAAAEGPAPTVGGKTIAVPGGTTPTGGGTTTPDIGKPIGPGSSLSIDKIYNQAYGRNASDAEKSYLNDAIAKGNLTLDNLAAYLPTTAEAKQYANTSLDKIYNQNYGRNASDAEKAYLNKAIGEGTLTRENLAAYLPTTAEAKKYAADQAYKTSPEAYNAAVAQYNKDYNNWVIGQKWQYDAKQQYLPGMSFSDYLKLGQASAPKPPDPSKFALAQTVAPQTYSQPTTNLGQQLAQSGAGGNVGAGATGITPAPTPGYTGVTPKPSPDMTQGTIGSIPNTASNVGSPPVYTPPTNYNSALAQELANNAAQQSQALTQQGQTLFNQNLQNAAYLVSHVPSGGTGDVNAVSGVLPSSSGSFSVTTNPIGGYRGGRMTIDHALKLADRAINPKRKS